jgi:hypothetical protein
VALPKALNEAWLIFQVLMVRIHFPPPASQQQTVPALGFDGATDCPKEPFAGAGPMVRIPFPPAESPRL